MSIKLSNIISVDSNAARSVNIERDCNDNTILQEYRVTAPAIHTIERFLAAMGTNTKSCAWSLTGPYGMGKSYFANFLLALTDKKNSTLHTQSINKLQEYDFKLANMYKKRIKDCNFFQIAFTAEYEPLERSLLKGLLKAITNNRVPYNKKNEVNALINAIKKSLSETDNKSYNTFIFFKKANSIFQIPFLLIIDELGKSLEYMGQNAQNGDIFILQQLAESGFVYLFVMLHQAFAEYADSMSNIQKEEWRKIQGRFEDISFIVSVAEMLGIASQVIIKKTNNLKISSSLISWAKTAEKSISITELSGTDKINSELIAKLYPIHPFTGYVLSYLCQKFAQNDRTLFAFLSSSAPNAFLNYLNDTTIDENKTLPSMSLDYLYEYFSVVLASEYSHRAETQRWLEINAIVESLNNIPEHVLKISKAIGVLNLLGGVIGLKASYALLKSGLVDTKACSSQELDSGLEYLVKKQIAIYRKYADEYRLWEGSDFDLITAVRKKGAELALKPVCDLMNKACPLENIVVAKHSYETQTMRKFECKWIDEIPDFTKITTKADGLVLYVLSPIKSEIPALTAENKPLCIVCSDSVLKLKQLAIEAAATQLVLETNSALTHDGIAKREARFKAESAKKHLGKKAISALSPGAHNATFFFTGERFTVRNSREFSRKLSDLCDEAYRECPKIDIEMLNVNKLSGSAAGARKRLVEAMIANEGLQNLGMTGFGPEVAIYRNIFLKTKLHDISDKTQQRYRLVAPVEGSNFSPMWNTINKIIIDAGAIGVCAKDIEENLMMVPFGMRREPIPLMLCYYLLVNGDNIAVYQEKKFIHIFGEAEALLLLRRTDLFSFKHVETSTTISRNVILAYCDVLRVKEIHLEGNIRNKTILRIVAPLINYINSLPEYSKRTRDISPEAIKVRAVLDNTEDPQKLLFEEIPKALNLPARNDSERWVDSLKEGFIRALLEIQQAYNLLNTKIQNVFMDAFDFSRQGEDGVLELFREELTNRVIPLVDACGDIDFRGILAAIASNRNSTDNWVRNIVGLITHKPVDSWLDNDFDVFVPKVKNIAKRIEHFEGIIQKAHGATRAGFDVISITLPDGGEKQWASFTSEKAKKKAQPKFNEIKKMADDERQALLKLMLEMEMDKNE